MDFFHFKNVSSTNIVACDLLKSSQAFLPFGVSADRQIDGVGTRGSQWISPEGNLYVTYMLEISPFVDISSFSLVVGLEIIKNFYLMGYLFKLELKWPNDIYCNNHKIGGVLITRLEINGQSVISIGIGINFLSAPQLDNVSYNASALSDYYDDLPNKESFLRLLGQRLNESLVFFLDHGFHNYRDEWNNFAIFLNKPVKFLNDTGLVYQGIFEGVSEQGAVIIRNKAEEKFFYSGKITPI